MRILACALVASLAVPSGLLCQAPPPSRTRQPAPAGGITAVPIPVENSHGHAKDAQRGTSPCGYNGMKCGSSDTPPAAHNDDHTGRNVAVGLGVGALAGLVIYKIATHRADHVNTLSEKGPQFPELLHMSRLQVTGFVKGGWPLVLDYEVEPGAYAALTIAPEGGTLLTSVLPARQQGRQMVRLQLPDTLGGELKIATFSIVSTVSQADPRLVYFRVYGIGAGPRAVGSVAIDQLKFGPGVVTAGHPDTQVGFHAHTTFDRVKAEFMQLQMIDHCIENKQFDDMPFKGRVLENNSVVDTWNAKKSHAGQIQFRVRGWMTKDGGGDWVSAFSPDLVRRQ